MWFVLYCYDEKNVFTIKTSTKGSKVLRYPIDFNAWDEMIFSVYANTIYWISLQVIMINSLIKSLSVGGSINDSNTISGKLSHLFVISED